MRKWGNWEIFVLKIFPLYKNIIKDTVFIIILIYYFATLAPLQFSAFKDSGPYDFPFIKVKERR
jgi:hypothetical protein